MLDGSQCFSWNDVLYDLTCLSCLQIQPISSTSDTLQTLDMVVLFICIFVGLYVFVFMPLNRQ